VKTPDIVLRKIFRPGEYALVADAGPIGPIVDPKTEEILATRCVSPYWGTVTTPL
jgi:hypothetical protein